MTAESFTFEDGVQGALLIAQERSRQMTEENFDADHDDKHQAQELLRAAVAYVMAGGMSGRPFRLFGMGAPSVWPWDDDFKPSDDPIRNLVKAGALIAAEIDRLTRAKEAEKTRPITVRRDDLQAVVSYVLHRLGRRTIVVPPPSEVEAALRRLQEADAPKDFI